ncbi:MAG: hypothetical protein AB7U82_27845 [Blastocatellales bacterium]
MSQETCSIRQDGDHVIIRFMNNESRVPYGAALDIAEVIKLAAKQAEAFANQNRMIGDDVLLKRAGLPKGLMRGGLLHQLFKRGSNA